MTTTDKGNKVVRYERFTQSAQYVEGDGLVGFRFADAIIPMLVELEKRFTSYEIEQVAQLSSQYAMRLYEFFMRHLDKKTGKGWLDISLDDLRFRFGLLSHEYSRMGDFKKGVLDFALKQINENTDLTATYTQKKQGRVIVGFHFEFKQKANAKPKKTKDNTDRDSDTKDVFDGLTDQEREIIANKNAYADQKGITDPLHRQNLINQALKQHRQAEQDEKAQQEREKAKRQAEQAKEQAEKQAQETLEKQKKEQGQIRRDTMIAMFESLTADEQDLILDEVCKKLPLKVFVDVFTKSRKTNEAHKNPMFAYYFYELFEI